MSGSSRNVGFRLSAEGAVQAKRDVESFGSTSEAVIKRVQAVADPTTASIKGLTEAAAGLGGGLRGLGGAAGSLAALGGPIGLVAAGLGAAGIAVVGLGSAIAKAGDQASVLQAKLSQVTGSLEGARIAYEGLYAISQRTGVSVSDSADTFARFRLAAGQVGATSAQVLKLTENLQKVAAVSGAAGQEGAAAMMQLAQALSSGQLNGDELRSLMENMPGLAAELANQMGISYGQMRKFGEEGKLTADKVLPALMKATAKMAEDFDRLPPTMERGFNILGSAMLNFGMNLDRALGLSEKIAKAAIAAADAVNKVQRYVAPNPYQQAENDVAKARESLTNLQNAPRTGPDPNDPNLAPIQRAQLQGADRARQEAIRRAEADLINANDRMRELQREAGQAQFGEYVKTTEKATENAKTQNALAVREVLESNNKKLKITREYNEELEKINKAERAKVDQIPGHDAKFDPVAARAAALKNYREELDKLDKDGKKAADAAEKLAEKTAKVSTALEIELDKHRRLAEARGKGEAAVKALNVQLEIESQIRAAGIPSADRRTQAQQEEADAIARTVTELERYKAIAKEAEDAQKKITDAQKKSQEEIKTTTDDVVKYSADRFADMFGRNSRGFKGLMDSFYDLAVKTFARIAAEAIIRPIIAPLVAPIVQGFAGALGGAGGGGLGDILGISQLLGGKSLLESIGLTGSGGLLSGASAAIFGSPGVSAATASLFGDVTGVAASAVPGSAGLLGTYGTSLMGGSALTLSGAFAGIGGGFAAGNLINSLLGRSPAQSTNGMIGSGIGAGLGFLVGGPVGGLIGGALGGFGGGLFGPGESVKGYGLRLQSEGWGPDATPTNQMADALKPIDYKYYNDTGKAVFQEAEQTVAAVNAYLKARDLQVGGVSIIGGNKNGADYSWADAGSVSEGFTRLRFGAKDDAQLTKALEGRTFTGVAGLQERVEGFIAFRDQMDKLVEEPLPEFTAALNAINESFDAAAVKARDYGLSEARLNEARAKQIQELEDRRTETLRQTAVALDVRMARAQGRDGDADLLEFTEKARLEIEAFTTQLDRLALTAEQKGAELVRLEAVQAEERAQIIRAANDELREGLLRNGGSIRQFIDGLKAGAGSTSSPTDRLIEAQNQFGRDLALARGGDEDALARITQTADTLLSAGRDNFASGVDFQALRQFVISSLETLPATQSYDNMILQALRDLGGSVDVSVGIEVVRVITEAINALPDADRAKLVQTATVLRTIEERLGRLLGSDEIASLVDGAVVIRSIEQSMGRDLSAAERAGLVAPAAVFRTIEQAIGRDLSVVERAGLLQSEQIIRDIQQAMGRDLSPAERAGLVWDADITRAIQQAMGRDLSPAERAGLVQTADITRAIQQAMARDLSAAERAGLVQGADVIRSIEQVIGRPLSPEEQASLVDGADVLRVVNQALGRQLTPAEVDGLIQAATVARTIEQTLGRNLTPAERELIYDSVTVNRGIYQTIFQPTGTIVVPENEAVLRGIFQQVLEAYGAQLLTPETVTRLIRQAVETTETVEISRSIDSKLTSIMNSMIELLDIIKSRVDTGNAALSTLLARTDIGEGGGGDMGGFARGGVFAGGRVVPFARGGIPSVVSSPHIAPMALFGEAGPEAIMPLSRGSDGRLGVVSRGQQVDMTPIVAALGRIEDAVRLSAGVQGQETRDASSRVVDKLQEMVSPLRRASAR